MSQRDLCRGWSASDIRTLVGEASDKQRAVLLEIAENPGTTTAEIADRLGWDSHRNVRATLSALAATTNAMGVCDSAGALSWPFVIKDPAVGTTFWRYYMPEEAAAVVRRSLALA